MTDACRYGTGLLLVIPTFLTIAMNLASFTAVTPISAKQSSAVHRVDFTSVCSHKRGIYQGRRRYLGCAVSTGQVNQANAAVPLENRVDKSASKYIRNIPRGTGHVNSSVPGFVPDSSPGARDFVDRTVAVVNSTFDAIFEPIQSSCNIFQGKWERVYGNFVLRPPKRAKAVIHFIGGAFVGAAPHIAYSTLLEGLSRRGYCVVATPFDLSLNYLETTAQITSKWEAIETDLALEYGPIPVIGVGHSAGALFHSVASSLFDDLSPKAANILISFNNKPLKDAIPLYDYLVRPIAHQSLLLEKLVPQRFLELADVFPDMLDAAIEGNTFTPQMYKEIVLPLSRDVRRIVQQLRPLIRELGGASRDDRMEEESESRYSRIMNEFYPSPGDIRSAISHLYCVGPTLVVKFSNDNIDESEGLMDCLRVRGGDNSVSMMELAGNHLTPLVQDVPQAASHSPGKHNPSIPSDSTAMHAAISIIREVISALGTKEMYSLEALIDEWIESGVANGTL